METNFKGMSYSDLHLLHEQLNKERGYAEPGRQEHLDEAIKHVVDEKNRRMDDTFGNSELRANTSGGVVSANPQGAVKSNSNDITMDKSKPMAVGTKDGKSGATGATPDK